MWKRLCRSQLAYAVISRRSYGHVPLIDNLTQRGFIQDLTHPEQLRSALQQKRQGVYVGVDPTASSLHIGHLLPLMCLLHFQIHGHRIIPLIGGATGRVGDPSGRHAERQLADVKQVDANVRSLTTSIQNFFSGAIRYAASRTPTAENLSEPQVTSNLDWHGSFNLLDFLGTVGIHARVNTMMNRESVRARLSAQQGLSFTEFTYQLLQAYDFYYLHRHHQCTIQIGGSDQWGNIVAGLELIGKISPEEGSNEAFGIVTPLLTTASGEKFGKSAGNAVWLDSNLTSVFDFYQYFVKVADADVGKYLKMFTLLPIEEIEEIVATHHRAPEKRMAQHKLASEVTEMVHSKSGAEKASTITRLLFDSDYANLEADKVITALEGDPRLVKLSAQELFETPVGKLASKHKLTASNSASKSLIASRGLYVNNESVPDPQHKIDAAQLLHERLAVVRAGKDKIIVFTVV